MPRVRAAFAILVLLAACGDSERTSGSEAGDAAVDVAVDAPSDAPADAVDERAEGVPDVPEMDVEVDASPDVFTDPDVSVDPDAQIDADVASEPVFRCEGLESSLRLDDLGLGVGWVSSRLEPCRRTVHPTVIPRGAVWEISARGLPDDARIFVYPAAFDRTDAVGDSPPPPLARSEFAGETGALELDVTAIHSGEHFIVVERDTLEFEGELELRVICREGCELEATRYPIVLVHGYAGVDSYFGLVEYFFDIHGRLEALGYDIHTPVTDPIATSEVRGAQLEAALEEIVAETGVSRMNLIAHSQGGLDSRLVASPGGLDRADLIASITSVSTPHAGVDAVLWDVFSEQDFSVDAMAEFNRVIVDSPDVRYWSWTARSCRTLGFGCQSESAGEIIDPLLIATYNLLSRFGDNDGIVVTESALWGEHLGLLYADHFDQIGQVADIERSGDPFDHRAFYLSEARRLAELGL